MLTEAQRLQRCHGLGGSDIAAIAGLSPYKTALDVYLDKHGLSEEREMTDFQRHGHIMEPVILNEYEKYCGKQLIRDDLFIQCKENSWMLGNLDAVEAESYALLKAGLAPVKIIDAKYVSSFHRHAFGSEGTSEMPDSILLQMIHYRIITNAEKVDVAVFFDRPDLYVYTYRKDESIENQVLEMEYNFWFNNVQKDIPPTPKSTADAKAMWRKARKDTSIVADDRDLQIWETLRDIRSQKKTLESQEDELKTLLQIKMADNEILSDAGGMTLASWKNQKTNRFDQAKFKKDHPELHKNYISESESRVFRLNMKEL